MTTTRVVRRSGSLGPALSLPRYPTNVYYNVANAQRAARRVQLPVLAAGARRRVRQHLHDDLLLEAGHVERVHRPRGLTGAAPRAGQRPPPALHAPGQHGQGRDHVLRDGRSPAPLQVLLQDRPSCSRSTRKLQDWSPRRRSGSRSHSQVEAYMQNGKDRGQVQRNLHACRSRSPEQPPCRRAYGGRRPARRRSLRARRRQFTAKLLP